MKINLIFFLFLLNSCINFKKEKESERCYSDTQCQKGFFCDQILRKCIQGSIFFDLFQDIKEIHEEGKIEKIKPACMEGQPCDDKKSCTYGDKCENGECKGVPYSCETEYDCIIGECRGDGSCTYNVKGGNCLINGLCYKKHQASLDNPCKSCIPEVSKYGFSNDDTKSCDDGDPCTEKDFCKNGKCVGNKIPDC